MIIGMGKKLFVFLLVIVLSGALFGAREKRKSEEEKTGPAKMEDISGPEVKSDSKAMAEREKAINQLLELLKDYPEGPRKAEVYRRLAELYWEKAKSIKAVIMDEYNKKVDKYYELNDSTAKMPELDLKPAWIWNNKAIDVCDYIIKKYSENYAGIDEVYFFMAANLMEVGQPLKAIRYYQLVTEKYGKSKYAADSYYQMGEYFFNNNNVFKAMPNYKAIVDRFPNDRFYTFALYKYAWCLYNVGEYAESIKYFQQVVENSNKDSKITLKEDALKDMVLPYAEAGSVDEAEKYFKTIVKDKKYYVMVLKKLASIYFDQDRSEEAVKIYRKLLAEDSVDADAPYWQKQIVECYKKMNNKEMVRKETIGLVTLFCDPASPWYKANEKDKATVTSAEQTAEHNLRTLLVEYHNEARKTKSDKTWDIVGELYPMYLKYFPKSEAAYDIRFNYAEYLFDRKKFQEAGDQYQIVADMNIKGSHFEDASYGAVTCFGALLEEEHKKQREKAKESLAKREEVEIREGKVEVAGQGGKKEIKELPKALPIPELDQKFIKACQTYITNIPRSKYLVDIIYKEAITYYAYNHFAESVPIFEMIVQKYPRDELAVYAADLIMTALDFTEDWEAISNKAREFLKNTALISGRNRLKGDLEKFKEMATFYAAELPVKQEKYQESADRYMAFLTEFPTSKFDDVAMNNAIVYYEKGGDVYKSIRVQERFLEEKADIYKKSKLRDSVMFGLAKNYAAIAYYDKAAVLYTDFAEKQPDSKNAGDAVYNAAVLYEALGDTEKSIDNYKLYISKYEKDPKEQAKIALQFGYIWMRKGKSYYDKAKKGFQKYLADYTTIKGLQDFYYLGKEGKPVKPEKEISVVIDKGEMNIIFAVYAAFVKMAKEENDLPGYYGYLDKTLQLFRNGQFKDRDAGYAEPTRDVVAEAMIAELQTPFDRFTTINLSVPFKPKMKGYEIIQWGYDVQDDKVVHLGSGNPDDLTPGEKTQLKAAVKERDTFNEETKNRITEKADLLVDLEKKYMLIIEVTKSPRYTPAALYYIGMLYKDMTEKMFKAPLPPWLNENQKIAYKNMLDEKALAAREKAVEAFETAVAKAYQTSVYNGWVLKADDMLKYFQELRPGKYYDENELFPKARMIETSSLIGKYDVNFIFPPMSADEKKALMRKLIAPPPQVTPAPATQPAAAPAPAPADAQSPQAQAK